MRTYPRTHARTHASYVARVYQEEEEEEKEEEEEEEEEPRHVWRRKIAPSASFSLDLERKAEARILRRHFSPTSAGSHPALARHAGHYLSTSYYSPRVVLTSLAHSFSLFPSFSRICRHDRNGRARAAREIEYLPRQDARGRIHGAIAARLPARSRFFSVIPRASCRARIIVPFSHPFAN